LIIAQCTGLRIPIVTVALPIEREQKDAVASLIQRDIRKAIAVIPCLAPRGIRRICVADEAEEKPFSICQRVLQQPNRRETAHVAPLINGRDRLMAQKP